MSTSPRNSPDRGQGRAASPERVFLTVHRLLYKLTCWQMQRPQKKNEVFRVQLPLKRKEKKHLKLTVLPVCAGRRCPRCAPDRLRIPGHRASKRRPGSRCAARAPPAQRCPRLRGAGIPRAGRPPPRSTQDSSRGAAARRAAGTSVAQCPRHRPPSCAPGHPRPGGEAGHLPRHPRHGSRHSTGRAGRRLSDGQPRAPRRTPHAGPRTPDPDTQPA